MSLLAAGVMLLIMAYKDHLNETKASFIVTQAQSVTIFIAYMMLQRGNLNLALNSIERLTEYSTLEPEKEGPHVPPATWPENGKIVFEHVCARYRPELPLALSNISFEILGGEKIGVVGRTGSGKRSLLLTVFRLIPLEPGSQLIIDDVDTASMPLENLRSKISAIPQEPVIFSGNVRDNLDPFHESTDKNLVHALELCHLYENLRLKTDAEFAKNWKEIENEDPQAREKREEEMKNPLDLQLKESSLSVGEKQLLCLARALQRNQKILVLDEATSSVDPHTDKIIQETIRTAFATCTVITVAHRLNTIMDSDRILVLDKGNVVEFDAPGKLQAIEGGHFARLVAEANMSSSTHE